MVRKKNSLSKLYYSIGEVAALLEVNTSLIRYWEKEFSQVKPRKNRRGVRMFTQQDINTLQHIKFLVKGQGYTLEGARKIIEAERNGEADVVGLLSRLHTLLTEIRNHLPETKT